MTCRPFSNDARLSHVCGQAAAQKRESVLGGSDGDREAHVG